ncbi:uncharacterized protein J8A68_000074, partial [[Candida] subhashii]
VKPSQLVITFRSLSQYRHNPQIYIHELNPNIYKFSLSTNPNSLDIGISDSVLPTPESFKSNPKFLELVHETIRDHIDQDFTYIIEGGVNKDGYMPIYDLREMPENTYARVPPPENVFGYVQVDKDGKIIKGTYQPNKLYRSCTSTSGLNKFSDYILDQLKAQIN